MSFGESILCILFILIPYQIWRMKKEFEKAWERIEKMSPEEKKRVAAGTLNSAGWI